MKGFQRRDTTPTTTTSSPGLHRSTKSSSSTITCVHIYIKNTLAVWSALTKICKKNSIYAYTNRYTFTWIRIHIHVLSSSQPISHLLATLPVCTYVRIYMYTYTNVHIHTIERGILLTISNVVLQCVTVWCSLVQCGAVSGLFVLWWAVVCCSML